jgi:hypothetical protein
MRDYRERAPVAQGIERLPSKQRVAGSNPAGRATLNCVLPVTGLALARHFFLCTDLGNIGEQLIFELIDGLPLSSCALRAAEEAIF